MSGGHFNYDQSRIRYIADEIEELITSNDDRFGYGYSAETIAEFEKAVKYLRLAYIYAHRVDWLVSGDDGEESFHQRLKEQLNRLESE